MIKVIFLSLILVGCASELPIHRTFPDVPKQLMEEPKELKKIDSSASSSEVFQTIIENYGQYHELSDRLIHWQKWYNSQKKLYQE